MPEEESQFERLPISPLCVLRPDLADELGFGRFLAAIPEAGLADPDERMLNRKMGLSTFMPRYVAFYTRKGEICITADAGRVYRTPMNALFRAALRDLANGVAKNPIVSSALRSLGQSSPLEASPGGAPHVILVQETHTGETWLWPANEASKRFLQKQSQ